jgi:hypothetical protein
MLTIPFRETYAIRVRTITLSNRDAASYWLVTFCPFHDQQFVVADEESQCSFRVEYLSSRGPNDGGL